MTTVADLDDLFRAYDDAIAIAKEWDGASVAEKLAAFNLDAADVKVVLAERYEAYKRTGTPEEQEFFVAAALESLLAGMKLRREPRDVA